MHVGTAINDEQPERPIFVVSDIFDLVSFEVKVLPETVQSSTRQLRWSENLTVSQHCKQINHA